MLKVIQTSIDTYWLFQRLRRSSMQMIETRAWKKIRGLVEEDKCHLCGRHSETVQHLLSGCKKLAGSEYVKRHDNTLKVLVVKWAIENALHPENTKLYAEKWEQRKVLKHNGKKLLGLGTSNEKKLDCKKTKVPNAGRHSEYNDIIDRHGVPKRGKQGGQTRRKNKEIPGTMPRAARTTRGINGYGVPMISMISGCLGGGGMKEMKENVWRRSWC